MPYLDNSAPYAALVLVAVPCALTNSPRNVRNLRKANMTLSLTFLGPDLVKADASRAASGFPARGTIHRQPAD